MATAKLFIQIAFFTAVVLSQGCTSSVLSKRTDDQAWSDFQKDLKARRTPASEKEMDSNETIQKLHLALDEVEVRKLILSCHSKGDAACYEPKLVRAFDEAFRTVQSKQKGLSDVVYKKEQQRFLAARSFEKVATEVQDFHRLLLSGMEVRARDRIADLHQECETASELEVRVYQPFAGGLSTLPKGYFACLNNRWDEDAKDLLSETTDRLGLVLTTQDAKDWIKDRHIDPWYQADSARLLAKRSADDEKAIEQDLEKLTSKMDWSLSLNAFVKKESEGLRAQYPFYPVEIKLTELYQKKRNEFKGVQTR